MNRTATRSMIVLALCAAIGGPVSAGAEEKPGGSDQAGKQTTPAKDPGASKNVRRTVYVPPSRGAVGARTGGGTRGQTSAPRIAVLAPDHVGLTTRAQPSLAWYLSADTSAPVELTLIADGAIEPLAVKRLPSPQRAGIHVVDLSQLDVELAEGTTYDWYIALVLDPNARDADVVAGGAIARRSAPSALVADLKAPGPTYGAYARNGFWYDAIADLSTAIANAPSGSPESRALRAERAELLEQVGVGAVALYDRGGSDAASQR
jgi:hypothetical protein